MASHPWTRAARMAASRVRSKYKPPIEPLKYWDIVRGDTVQVMDGHRDAGKRGRIKEVIRKKNLIVVDGINLRTRRLPPSEEQPEGAFVKMPVPISYMHVSLIDPSDNQPCTVIYQRDENGKRVRVSSRTNTVIPKALWRRRDFLSRSEYEESPLDTKADVASAVTYKPTVLSFEEDVLKALGKLETKDSKS